MALEIYHLTHGPTLQNIAYIQTRLKLYTTPLHDGQQILAYDLCNNQQSAQIYLTCTLTGVKSVWIISQRVDLLLCFVITNTVSVT